MEQPTTQAFVLQRSSEADLGFTGIALATVSSNTDGDHEGKKTDRWTELTTYATDKGQFVVHVEAKSSREGETTLSEVHVMNKLADIPTYLPMTWLTKKLLAKLGIEPVEYI